MAIRIMRSPFGVEIGDPNPWHIRTQATLAAPLGLKFCDPLFGPSFYASTHSVVISDFSGRYRYAKFLNESLFLNIEKYPV